MNIHAEKIDIIQWIASINDKTILQQLKTLKEQSIKKSDWWDSISEEERQSIDEGLEDAKNGRTVPHSEVRKMYEKWL
jgi:predicted transcriptional regulator